MWGRYITMKFSSIRFILSRNKIRAVAGKRKTVENSSFESNYGRTGAFIQIIGIGCTNIKND